MDRPKRWTEFERNYPEGINLYGSWLRFMEIKYFVLVDMYVKLLKEWMYIVLLQLRALLCKCNTIFYILSIC